MGSRLDGTDFEIQEAINELHAFATDTLNALINLEKLQTGAGTTLSQFCRVDISMMQTENGDLDYFVNEVERGPDVCLWAGEENGGLLRKVAEKFLPSLHTWIADNVA
jgi:hypothetical protein